MTAKFERKKFEHHGWTVTLTGNDCETTSVGHADIYQSTIHCYRITLSSPTADKSAFFKKLAGMASIYIDECVADLVQRNAELTSAFFNASPNAEALLSRLIYVGWSSHPISVDVPDILRQSTLNNQRSDVTGALCFLDGVYLQYLEGPAAAVEALFQKIEVDGRHHMPKLLDRRFVTERSFEQWSMAAIRWDDECDGILRTHADGARTDLYQVPPGAAAALFRKFVNTKCLIPV